MSVMIKKTINWLSLRRKISEGEIVSIYKDRRLIAVGCLFIL